jgi:tetratricopeptide (TPR) repeat protein
MNSLLPIRLKHILVASLLFIACTAGAQATRSALPHELQLEKARSLFEAGQYEAAESFITSIMTEGAAASRFNKWDEVELYYMQMVSGIILHQETAITRAKQFLEDAESRQNKVKLAYHLGHHYFVVSAYAEAIEWLEKTDAIHLSNDENERVQFEKGVSYFSERKFDNAKPYFRSLDQLQASIYRDDVKYYLGFIAFSEKKFSEAGSLFKSIESSPAYQKVVPFYQACIAQATGNALKAISYAEKYLQGGDNLHQKEVSLLLASSYHNTGEDAKSVALFKKTIDQGVQLSSTHHFELGSGYYALGQYDRAIMELKPLSASNDQLAAKSMLILGNCYLQLGQKANARSAFQICASSLEAGEQLDNVRFQLAKLSLEMGYEDIAIQELNKVIQDQPSSVYANEARSILVNYYAKTNNFRQALLLIQEGKLSIASLQAIAPRIFFGRGIELINDLQYDEADKLLAELSKYKNAALYAPSLFWRGEIASRRDQLQQVIKFTQEFLRVRTADLGEANLDNALYNLGYAFFDQEEYKLAAVQFEKIMQSKAMLDKDFKREATLRAADCAFMTKQIERAKVLYLSMKDSPGYGADYAHFQLAQIEGTQFPERKIQLLKTAEMKFPQSDLTPLITMELADTYMAEEQFDKSIPYLKRIASLVDKDDERMPESLLKMGIAYYNLNRLDESVMQYKKLIDAYPASTFAQEALESVKLLYVETGKINDYEQFLKASGRSMDQLQKDSLMFQIVQSAYAEGNNETSKKALSDYEREFPDGLFIAEILNYKSEMFMRDEDWKNAALSFEKLAGKGVSKYQEKAWRQSGKLYFFELKDYESALRCFNNLAAISSNKELILEAQRGEIRSYFQLKKWNDGRPAAKLVLENNSSNTDDKSFAQMVLGYAEQSAQAWISSNANFRAVVLNNKAALAAEARYQLAQNQFLTGNFDEAEKLATEVIEKSGSYEYWITKAYILIGQVFMGQKDYFNARATLKSVVDNCTIAELNQEAMTILSQLEKMEKDATSK